MLPLIGSLPTPLSLPLCSCDGYARNIYRSSVSDQQPSEYTGSFVEFQMTMPHLVAGASGVTYLCIVTGRSQAGLLGGHCSVILICR